MPPLTLVYPCLDAALRELAEDSPAAGFAVYSVAALPAAIVLYAAVERPALAQ